MRGLHWWSFLGVAAVRTDPMEPLEVQEAVAALLHLFAES